MKKGGKHDPREAIGCFIMLILGAIMTLGGMVIVVPESIEALLGKNVPGWWRSILVWVIAPAVGIALAAWLTYRFRTPRRPKKPS
jgi:hypothetical protein